MSSEAADETLAAGERPEQQPSPTGETAPTDEAWDPERARALIGRLRQEARAHLRELKDLEALRAERREREQDKLSESERLAQHIKTLEAERDSARHERQEALNRSAAIVAAQKAGCVDPDAVVRLLDWSALEYGPDGTPHDVEGAVATLLSEKTYLMGQPAASTPGLSPTNGPTRQGGPGQRTYTRSQLADYTFYRAHQTDIQAAVREGRVLDQ